jgi:hypothetical protein
MPNKNTLRRRRRRQQDGKLWLFSPVTTLGWRATRWIHPDEGERKVAIGQLRHVLDPSGKLIGYQMAEGMPRDENMPSRRAPVSLSVHDMELIAGQTFPKGKSKTAGLPEDLRISRVHPLSGRALPPEDDVERAVAKLGAYAETRLR